MKFDFGKITRKFLLGESYKEPTVESRIQTLYEILENIMPKTASESRRLEVAKEQVRGIRRQHKKMLENYKMLEERVRMLEENINVK